MCSLCLNYVYTLLLRDFDFNYFFLLSVAGTYLIESFLLSLERLAVGNVTHEKKERV